MLAIFTFAVALAAASGASAAAQPCLHGDGETTENAARRRQALTAARTINTMQANQAGAASRSFLRHDELANAPSPPNTLEAAGTTAKPISLKPGDDIVPGWKLTLDVTSQGYWFLIKDTLDPCGFAYVSNQNGVIFNAEPIR